MVRASDGGFMQRAAPMIVALALGLGLAGLPAWAQDKQDHSQHGGHAGTAVAAPWAAAYDAANAVMHRDMAIAYSNNPDLDFARAMLAHHQGAVDMARIQLQHGTDAKMRALAQAIIAAQMPEIEALRAFITKSGG
jgi:uncharacterized protein (DUF305 family)